MTILDTVSALASTVATGASAPKVSVMILIANSELTSSAPTISTTSLELLKDGIEIGAAIVLEVKSSMAAELPENSMSYESVRR